MPESVAAFGRNSWQGLIRIIQGLVIYHKKLENGSFKLPSFDENTTSLHVSWHDLMGIVSDVKIKKRRLKNRIK